MSINKKIKPFKYSIYWASCSVLLLFLGLIFMVSFQSTPFRNLGIYTISISVISLAIYFLYSLFYTLFYGNKSLKKNLIIIYLSSAFLLVIGGIINVFLYNEYGWSLFFLGLILLISFWLSIFSYFLLFSIENNRRIKIIYLSISFLFISVLAPISYIFKFNFFILKALTLLEIGTVLLLIYGLGFIAKLLSGKK